MDNKKLQVINAGVKLVEEGLIARTWGNVSVRTDAEHFAITASGREYHSLTTNDIVNLDLADLNYSGDVKPSGEKKVHQVIYQLMPDAGFVIHTHQNNASAVAAMGYDKVKLPEHYEGIGDVLPCAAYGLPGTQRVADNVAKALASSDSKAILMANHGAVCYGSDAEEAFQVVRNLELACGKLLTEFGIEADPEFDSVAKWPHASVRVYLDDFAQMFGARLRLVDYDPAALATRYGEDVEAVRMVVDKNCRAALAAKVTGAKPISWLESIRMRSIYVRKYSKLKDKNNKKVKAK